MLRQTDVFPTIHPDRFSFSLLVIPIKTWESVQPPDDYLKIFLRDKNTERWVIIWEDIWIHKNEIVKDRLRSYAGISRRIHARKCIAQVINPSSAKEFLDNNHLLGYTQARYRYALLERGEIMGIATFGRAVPAQRCGKEVQSHELIRFCHRVGHHVSGGLTKLLAHFRKDVHPEDIFTSVDREWSAGQGYAKIGFSIIEQTPPMCFYLDDDLLRHRNKNGNVRICNAGNIRMALTYI